MNRTTAENLLALLIFDELDEPLKTELLAYLQTDAELAARLHDMRQSVELIELGVRSAEPLTLDAHRQQKILRAGRTRWNRPILFTFRRAAAAAAILLLTIGLLGMVLLPSLGRVRMTGAVNFENAPTFDLSVTSGEQGAVDGKGFGIFGGRSSPPPASTPSPAPSLALAPSAAPPESRLWAFSESAARQAGGETPGSRESSDYYFRGGQSVGGAMHGLEESGKDKVAAGSIIRGDDAAKQRTMEDGISRARPDSPSPQKKPTSDRSTLARDAERRWADASINGRTSGPVGGSYGSGEFKKNAELTRDARNGSASFGAAVSSDAGGAGAITSNSPPIDRSSGTKQLADDLSVSGKVRSINGVAYDADIALDIPRSGSISSIESKPEPLPQVARAMAAMQMAEQLKRADETPEDMIADARRAMRKGDVYEAERTLDRLREETGIPAEREGLAKEAQKLEKLQEQAQSLNDQSRVALSDGDKAKLKEKLFILEKEIDLSYRLGGDVAMAKEAAQQDLAEAVDEHKALEPEKPLVVGDALGIATFNRRNSDEENAWKMQVDSAGRIAVPQVGYFDARGRTPTQVRDEIERKLGELGRKDLTVALAVAPKPEIEEPGEISTEDANALPPASQFVAVPVNPWVLTQNDYFSTFGLDTDTASYTLARRYLQAGYRPPQASVRMEEFVNAFDYNYPTQQSQRVFNIHTDAAPADNLLPAWSNHTVLLKIGVKAKTLGREGRKPAHLIFVIDASGSMAKADRLPLVQYALTHLVDQLDERDHVTVIAYRTEAELLVEHENIAQRDAIKQAISNIQPRASTNLLAGLESAYQIAARYYQSGRINRIIICSDGAANIGETDAQAILSRVDHYRQQGITLTTAGFGFGNFNDDMMSTLAKKGDGNYVFIDSRNQADETFVKNLSGTLQTVAKDAKIQVEFNPAVVRRYRLIGYERRDIADSDFRNDAIDAGEVGSGQSATALYQLELMDSPATKQDDLGTVFVRYRDLDTNKVEEISSAIERTSVRARTPAEDPRFYLAACAGQFAEVLRGSPYADGRNLPGVLRVISEVAAALPLDKKVAELRDLIGSSLDKSVAP